MKKQKPMSSRQRRIAGHWLGYYGRLMAKPQRGIITYGGGLNILAWIADAEAEGFHCTLTPAGVVLR
jgi:hypothetical protein